MFQFHVLELASELFSHFTSLELSLYRSDLHETKSNIYPVDAGLFFKSFFYIAGVYWKNIII